MPIYFVAPFVNPLGFSVSVTVDTALPISWGADKDEMRPPELDAGAWDAVWPALVERLDDTWQEYLAVLRGTAKRLRGRGLEV